MSINRERWFPRPTGRIRARVHGASRALREWADSATKASKEPDTHPEFAASLRGKAMAYREAADLFDAIEDGRRLARRWRGKREGA